MALFHFNDSVVDTNNQSKADNTGRHIKFKVSLLSGIELIISGYNAEELASVNKIIGSRWVWLIVIVVLSLILAFIPQILNFVLSIIPDTS